MMMLLLLDSSLLLDHWCPQEEKEKEKEKDTFIECSQMMGLGLKAAGIEEDELYFYQGNRVKAFPAGLRS